VIVKVKIWRNGIKKKESWKWTSNYRWKRQKLEVYFQ